MTYQEMTDGSLALKDYHGEEDAYPIRTNGDNHKKAITAWNRFCAKSDLGYMPLDPEDYEDLAVEFEDNYDPSEPEDDLWSTICEGFAERMGLCY